MKYTLEIKGPVGFGAYVQNDISAYMRQRIGEEWCSQLTEIEIIDGCDDDDDNIYSLKDLHLLCPNLESLYLDGLTFQELCIFGDKMVKLKLGFVTISEKLHIFGNKFTTLSLGESYVPNIILQSCPMETLYVSDYTIKKIELIHMTKLRDVDLSKNDISELNLSGCPNLQRVDAHGNDLKEIIIPRLHHDTEIVAEKHIKFLQIIPRL